MENDSKTTGVRHDDKITGVGRDNKSTGVKSESGSMGATDKAYEMAIIEEAIEESDRDIAEGTDLLAGTETETEDTWGKNVIHPDFQVPTLEHTYNLRQRRNPSLYYTNRYEFQDTIIHCDLTQLLMKHGLKRFKQKGKKSVNVELEQLHRMDAFWPVKTENPPEKQKNKWLTLLMFLKENLDGSIKGRGVANGRKQREKIESKDTTSPIVSAEAVMPTATIDALEGRDVAVAEMMVAADPALFWSFVSYETVKAVLYVRLHKALYGCLKAHCCFTKS